MYNICIKTFELQVTNIYLSKCTTRKHKLLLDLLGMQKCIKALARAKNQKLEDFNLLGFVCMFVCVHTVHSSAPAHTLFAPIMHMTAKI